MLPPVFYPDVARGIVDVRALVSLLEVLRDNLSLTGCKEGCNDILFYLGLQYHKVGQMSMTNSRDARAAISPPGREAAAHHLNAGG